MELTTSETRPGLTPLAAAEQAVLEALRLAAHVHDSDAVAKYADALRALRGN